MSKSNETIPKTAKALNVDDIATQLSSTHISKLSSKTSTTRTAVKPVASSSRNKIGTSSQATIDRDLVTKLANARLSDPVAPPSRSVKGKERVAPSKAAVKNVDGSATALAALKSASQTLADAVQLRWKVSQPTKDFTFKALVAVASSARDSLRVMRSSPKSAPIESERGASHITGKLIALELFDQAIEILLEAKPFMDALYSSTGVSTPKPKQKTSRAQSSRVDGLRLAPPSNPEEMDFVLVSVLGAFQLYSLQALAPSIDDDSVEILIKEPTLLAWNPALLFHMPEAQRAALLTSAFQAVAKCKAPLSPRSSFNLRAWALRCLILCPTLDGNAFWEQVGKYASSFIRSTGLEAREAVSALFDELVLKASLREDSRQYLSGKGFLNICEYWTKISKAGKDSNSLTKIQLLLANAGQNEGSASNSSVPSPELQSARLCTAISQSISVVDSLSTDPDTDFSSLRLFVLSVEQCTAFVLNSGTDSEYIKKVELELERLRRVCDRLLMQTYRSLGRHDESDEEDAPPPSSIPVTPSKGKSRAMIRPRPTWLVAVTQLLSTVISHFEATHTTVKDPVYIYGSITSLTYLAQTTATETTRTSHTTAYDFLERCIPLLELLPSPSREETNSRKMAEGVCNAYWRIGGSLHQNGDMASAIPWFVRTCEVGTKVLAMDDLFEDEEGPASRVSLSRSPPPLTESLAHQIPRRWELLGFCQLKTGDRMLALDAFMQGLKASKRSLAGLGNAANLNPISSLFATDPFLRGLSSLVQRLITLATFDLFTPEQGSVLYVLREDGIIGSAVGALLEHQYDSLSNLPNARKQEAIPAFKALLKDTLEVYDAEQYPIRRARSLLRQVERSYYDGESVKAILMIEDVQELLSSQTFARDQDLALYAPQFLAQSHLWGALLEHSNTPPGSTPSMEGLSIAAKILREHVLPRPNPPSSPSQKILAEVNDKTNTTVPPKKGRSAPPRTPKKAIKRTPSSKRSLPIAQPSTPIPVMVDGFSRLEQQLELAGRIAGVLGFVLVKLELLHVVCVLHAALQREHGSDGYVKSLIELAREYSVLGWMNHAAEVYAEALTVTKNQRTVLSDEIRLLCYLRYAEAAVAAGNTDQGLAVYAQAYALGDIMNIPPSRNQLSFSQVLGKVGTLERVALAANAFSAIQIARDEPVAALNGALQALRVWNKAAEILARVNQPPKAISKVDGSSSPNPFEVVEAPKDITLPDPERKGLYDGMQWRIAEGILETLFRLSHMYYTRGSPKEVEYFLSKALSLAGSLRATGMESRTLMRLGEMKLHLGQLDAGNDMLVKATAMMSQLSSVDQANIYHLQGVLNQKLDEQDQAKQNYVNASTALSQLDSTLATMETLTRPIFNSKLIRASVTDDEITQREISVPELWAVVLRQHIWLLRDEAGEDSEYTELLDRFLALPLSTRTQIEESALMGKLTLNEVYARFRGDIVLSSLPESMIALPTGMSGGEVTTPLSATRDILSALSASEKYFWTSLELNATRGEVSHIREAAVSLALIRAYQSSLGHKSKNSAAVTVSLLDMAIAQTLRRELLDCIEYKFVNMAQNDLVWPSMTATGSPVRPAVQRPRALLFTEDSDSDDDSETEIRNISMKSYWRDVRERLRAECWDAASLTSSQADMLPDNWMAVTISVTEDKSTIIISSQRPHREPLIFYLPLDRQERREDADTGFSYQDAVDELAAIITASDDNTRGAPNVQGRLGKVAWWAERDALDKRLQDLLQNIEYCWLGAFKTVFNQTPSLSSANITSFRTRLENVFKRNGCAPDKKQKMHLRLDDALLSCFGSLSPQCRDEELEDLAYFILDLYQLHGAPVIVSEIDVDQLVIDLRTALEEHAAASASQAPPSDNQHLFLILDKNLQGLPWESIPILRNRSVSRIPSMSFLVDRIHLARHLRGLSALSANGDSEVVDRIPVDPRKTFFILNPSGDLKNTEERFSSWVIGMKSLGWDGIVGRAPSEEEMINALSKYDLVIYFGHGGAEQYVKSQKVRHLPRCATTLLWGCSSGALRDMGDFDRTGTPYNYMIAGCPSLVACLWDITDKDLDKCTEVFFDKVGLTEDHIRSWTPPTNTNAVKSSPTKGRSRSVPPVNNVKRMSNVTALAQARDSCKLKYLTGAAPVVYGIPFYL